MKKTFAIGLLVAGLMPVCAQAQDAAECCALPDQQQQEIVQQQAVPMTYAPEQLDQLLAPVALYPDEMLGQVLMASTYPLEVVEAYRWVSDPNNAQMQGDALATAMQSQSWDPSVKSLVAFPQTLKIMNDNLQWTEQLGEAFMAQQAGVTDSVQRLRQHAQASQTLRSSPQQVVSTEGENIVIQPANPQVVYVPTYNPVYAYGTWPYPNYQPYYFNDVVYSTATPLPIYSSGIAVVAPLRGWNRWDWRNRRIAIDDRRYYELNRNRPPVRSQVWQHDSDHRGNVAYNNPAVRTQYQQQWRERHNQTQNNNTVQPKAQPAPTPNQFHTVSPANIPPAVLDPNPAPKFNTTASDKILHNENVGQDPNNRPKFNPTASDKILHNEGTQTPATQPGEPHSWLQQRQQQQRWQHASNQVRPQQQVQAIPQPRQYQPMIGRHASPDRVTANTPRAQPQLRYVKPQVQSQPVMMRQPVAPPNVPITRNNNNNNNGARQAHDGRMHGGNNDWHR